MASAAPQISYPPELPVSSRREELLAAIADHQAVVVAGETGSGKTTQLPKLCLEAGRRAIAHTQPRRIAARSVAARIAHELGVPLGGDTVGYAVRFDDRSSAGTRIRLLTDGLLLAQIARDRELRRYDTIIVDEAHERSLNVDFLLGYLHALLPRRPELRLIITSATIDPGRFSDHFGGAPVIEVSGRTHPVELRHRPPEHDDDPIDAVCDAVEELLAEASGDVLVFLSGEREIRDAAEALEGRLGAGSEIMPLYARLAPAEQERVFAPHAGRRVVLATNVAETSLTVPGIGAVVDAGSARISRYSARLKVQRLPIEPISQASATQRAGRCGRTGPGICVRLYSEADLAARPAFTDPEILRTSLAAVILQMEALGLGEVERFGFLDAPDPRQVRDGRALLHELGALDPEAADPRRRLTALGRRLARLPVDPRLGRMVLEAGRRGCAEEVIVIAAALSIQDPRLRPAERREQADALHARFADPRSDFLAYVDLWRHLHERRAELSGSAFRRLCHDELLHYLRVREWQDLAGQLRRAARDVGVPGDGEPAQPAQVHRALLAGLLSHVGMREASGREYAGARGARFALSPGSSLARRPPPWVMVAELVETTRLLGHVAARISPRWIEPLAGHLLRRTRSEPRWDARRGAAVATERATLYGLPVVDGRTVPLAASDPRLARELFIARALVEGDWDAGHEFLQANRRLVAEVEALEHRARRRDILASGARLHEFFDERLPDAVVSGASFERWWREERRRRPDLLRYTRALLTGGDDALDERALPEALHAGGLRLALRYRFEPGAADDGITVEVPLAAIARLAPEPFAWLVPGRREELVTALLRALPKDVRRALQPLAGTARGAARALPAEPEGALAEALAGALERVRGVRVDPALLDARRLPAHLRPRFAVLDEDGVEVAAGDDLDELRERVRPRLRARLAGAAAPLERTGLRDWSIGELPRCVELPGSGGTVRAYPALVDEGDSAAVRALATPTAQAAAMRAGTRRLLRLTVPSPLPAIARALDARAALTLAGAPHGGAPAALEDALVAALDELVAAAGGPAWDARGFAALRERAARELPGRAAAVVAGVVAVLDAAAALRARLDALGAAPALQPARLDVARQLGGLVHPGFAAAAGAARLPDLARYLRAAEQRIERLPAAVAADRDRMAAIHELEAEYAARGGRAAAPAVHWLLQELRVARFAQGLGVRDGASAKRIRRELAGLGAGG